MIDDNIPGVPVRREKPYSVKPGADGLGIKQRYQKFREEKARVVREIEQHDRKMAASARRLLSVRHDEGKQT